MQDLVKRLQRHYGAPQLPPAQGPFELILWENACYLLPEARRAAVFEGLRTRVGLTPRAILDAEFDTLLPLATMGGMRPDVRVERWREISQIAETEFDGDVNRVLQLPPAKAKKALKLFPNIGDPGAEKILMMCGAHPGLALESNSLRVLTRVGFGRQQKNYGTTYRSVQESLAGSLPKTAAELTRAYFTLRQHGQETCRRTTPDCMACPVRELCAAAKSATVPVSPW
ncbi:MAG TPA: hypothetical protein VN736_08070 [Candidatus Limnocylindrales bacterium]|nr:hypothetical protein [Candidatus Limnocylindrales bacterium]